MCDFTAVFNLVCQLPFSYPSVSLKLQPVLLSGPQRMCSVVLM